jgi:chromosome segregation ATPase
MKLDLNLTEIEELALSKDAPIHVAAGLLVCRVRQLTHELADPNYLYAGGRICRQIVVSRNEKIKELIKELKEKNQVIEQAQNAIKQLNAQVEIAREEIKTLESQRDAVSYTKD